MTIRLSNAQARALGKLNATLQTAAEIGETEATCNALVTAGYAVSCRIDQWTIMYMKKSGAWE